MIPLNRCRCRWLPAACVVAAPLARAAIVVPTTLVEIDFDAASPGSPPSFTLDLSPDTFPVRDLTRSYFGTQEVVGSAGSMHRPLRLLPTQEVTSNFRYSQVEAFHVLGGASEDYFHFEFDFLLSGFATRSVDLTRSVDQFSILFDMPSVQRLDFSTNGSIGRISYNSTPVYVGEFTFDEVHAMDILVDVPGGIFTASLDGVQLFEDRAFFGSERITALTGLRINLTDDAMLASVPEAYIDNLRLRGAFDPIPEPRSWMLLAASLAALARRRTR